VCCVCIVMPAYLGWQHYANTKKVTDITIVDHQKACSEPFIVWTPTASSTTSAIFESRWPSCERSFRFGEPI
jgi:hypothetical protein